MTVARVRNEQGFVTAFVVCLFTSFALLAGLVIDGGYVLAARRQAFNEAEAAARAGAQAMSGSTLTGGPVAADPTRATDAARAYLAAVGHSGTVSITGDVVAVTVSFSRRMLILGLGGIAETTVSGSARVRAVRGVTGAEL